MGLDIGLSIVDSETFCPDYCDDVDYRQHHLSRTFCTLMCRLDDKKSEFAQLSQLVSVDIQPLRDMREYSNEYLFEDHDSEVERQEMLAQLKVAKRKITDNLDKVTRIIDTLIQFLSVTDDIPRLIEEHVEFRNWKRYFSDFMLDTANERYDNNFGQDLRNFRRFLEYARSCGGKSVSFSFY